MADAKGTVVAESPLGKVVVGTVASSNRAVPPAVEQSIAMPVQLTNNEARISALEFQVKCLESAVMSLGHSLLLGGEHSDQTFLVWLKSKLQS